MWTIPSCRAERTPTYWVLVRNTADLTVLSVPTEGLGGKPAAPIRIFEPVFDHRTATAQIRWSRFPGVTFNSYELIRRSAQDVQTLAILQGPADTTFTDINLLGNVEYTYQVALNRTDGRRLVLSAEPDGIYLLHASFGSFSDPQGMDVDASGQHIYVADAGKIKKYNSDGSLLLTWGEQGEEDHQFFRPPKDVAVDQAGNVWVTVPGVFLYPFPAFVKKFDTSGQFLLGQEVGEGGVTISNFSLAVNGDVFVLHPLNIRTDNDDVVVNISVPVFSRIDPQGNVLHATLRINTSDAHYIGSFSNTLAITTPFNGVLLYNIDNLAPSLTGQFSGPGGFNNPQGLDFDATGQLFVVDAGNNRMQVFDDVEDNPTSPTFITQWALPSEAKDVAVDNQGNVYVIAGGQVHRYVP